MRKFLVFLLASFLCFLNLGTGSTEAAIKINKIVINGNRKYNSDYYLGLTKLKINDTYSEDSCNTAVKDMFSSGCLDDIKTNFNSTNGVLTFTLKEKPFIRKIEFIGAKEFEKDEDAKEKLKLRTKEIISSKFLADDIENIKTFYKMQGYFKVSVKTEIEDLGNGSVDLIFRVNDGGKAKINKIYFIGNKTFSDDTLKDEIMSRENRFYRFGRTIRYDTSLLDYDVNLLSQFYNSKGYYAVSISTPIGVYNQINNTFDIIFIIEENGKYAFGKVEIEDMVGKVDKELLKEAIADVKTGDAFSSKTIQNIMEHLNYIYTEKGYSFISVFPRMAKGDEENMVDVVFIIKKEDKEYINKIYIKNNSKTNDNVIRSRLLIKEGNVYNDFSVRKSIQSLESTGFFEKVSYEESDGILDNQRDITIKVEEGSTGSIGASIGLSSLDGLTGNINYSERNLFGTGSALDFDLGIFGDPTKKAMSWRFSINYAKPNVFDTKIFSGAGFSIQDNNNSRNSLFRIGFDDFTITSSAFASYNITDDLSQRVEYKFEYKKLSNIDDSILNVMPKDPRYTSEVSTSLTYSRINNRYNPSDGYMLSTELSYAGILGNVDYIKTTAYAALYKSIYLDKVVFKLEGRAGYITSLNNNPLYPNDGFYLGGYSMRGFEFAGVGPRIKTGNDYASSGLSGTKMFYSNAELKFPIYTPKEFGIYGILFINAGVTTGFEENKNASVTTGVKEVGNIFQPVKMGIEDSGSIRSAYGLSILFQIKMLGNISLDFSRTLRKEAYDIDQSFRFNIGTRF